MSASSIISIQTSGSTGPARQFDRDEITWRKSLELESSVFGLDDQERCCVLASPAHSLWRYVHFRATQKNCAVLGADPSRLAGLRGIAEFAPTLIYTLPDFVPLLIRLGAGRLANLRRLLVGGGSWPTGMERLVYSAMPRVEIGLFYGSAECSFIGHSSPSQLPWYRLFPGVQVKATSEGELCVRSEMTASPEQWVNTGDCVELCENPMRIRLLGRHARLLRFRGEWLHPEPIEDWIRSRFALEQCALVALGDPPSRIALFYSGELPQSESKDFGDLRGQIALAWPRLPQIHRFERVPDWPRLASGKADLEALRLWAG